MSGPNDFMEKLPVVICTGSTPADIGYSHGCQLQSRIGTTLRLYIDMFHELGIGVNQLREWGEAYSGEIGVFSPELAEEIVGIATGAGRELWEIFVLNARSEILAYALKEARSKIPGECTALYCAASGLLAQNWDWDVRMDRLPVLLQIPRRGGVGQILTMTETGIVAKVGFNDCGLGVCLNFLAGPAPPSQSSGVPVHCLLRIALSCETLQEAEALLRDAPKHTSCHILLADMLGQFRMLEFAGPEVECAGSDPLAKSVGDGFGIEGADWQILPPLVVAHTNHYLHQRFTQFRSPIAHTKERYARVTAIVGEREGDGSIASGADEQLLLVKQILGDRGGAPRAILYDATAGSTLRGKPLGTICSVIMDLRSKRMHITRGDAMAQDYVQIPLLVSSL